MATAPTIGSNVEKVQVGNLSFEVCAVMFVTPRLETSKHCSASEYRWYYLNADSLPIAHCLVRNFDVVKCHARYAVECKLSSW